MRLERYSAWILLISFFATPILAEDQSKEAKAAFRRGVSLFQEESYAEAAKAFRQANKLKPAWTLLFNIGQSEAAARHYGLAQEAFESYLSLGGDHISEERRQLVLDELKRLVEVTGALEVEAPDGSVVIVDGMERGVLPLPGRIRVAIGVVHNVRILQEERTIHREDIKVTQGETVVVDVPRKNTSADGAKEAFVEPALNTSENMDSKIVSEGSTKRIIGWVSLVAGGALLTGAAVTGSIALARNNELKDRCADLVCSDIDKDYGNSRKLLALSSDILLGCGIAAAATGVVLLLVSKKEHDQESSQRKISVSPYVGGGTVGLGFSGSY